MKKYNKSIDIKTKLAASKISTVFAQIEARASIYLESRLDQAYIRDRLLFETGLYCFKEWLIKESLREATHQSTI